MKHASLPTLVLSCTGGAGLCATIYFKRLAAMQFKEDHMPEKCKVFLTSPRLELTWVLLTSQCLRGRRSMTESSLLTYSLHYLRCGVLTTIMLLLQSLGHTYTLHSLFVFLFVIFYAYCGSL